jgi:glycosyltransferase involved in cell wall biosynthesis
VRWFAREVLPELRARQPDWQFAIVGGKPAPEVQALSGQDGILVTGRVADVRPYLAHARVVVAPLRIARGIQNKVLEGMAMARPVVATRQALEGIDALAEREILVADEPQAMATAVMRAGDNPGLGPTARARVVADYNWSNNLVRVDRLLEA